MKAWKSGVLAGLLTLAPIFGSQSQPNANDFTGDNNDPKTENTDNPTEKKKYDGPAIIEGHFGNADGYSRKYPNLMVIALEVNDPKGDKIPVEVYARNAKLAYSDTTYFGLDLKPGQDFIIVVNQTNKDENDLGMVMMNGEKLRIDGYGLFRPSFVVMSAKKFAEERNKELIRTNVSLSQIESDKPEPEIY